MGSRRGIPEEHLMQGPQIFLPDEVPYESCPIRCMQLVYSKVTHHNTYTHGIRCASSISRKTAKENYER